MDAIRFIKERDRMCKSYKDCEGCPLERVECVISGTMQDDDCKRIVDAVKLWSKEHSRKTRSDEFLKHYPNATIGYYGVIDICPKAVDKNYTPTNGCENTSCDECSDEYWKQEVE